MDDYLKVVQGRPAGLVARYKMLGTLAFGLGLGLFLLLRPISPLAPNHTMVPFFSDVALVLSPWFYVVFVGFVVSGSANAVNLTDGLDGLATGLMAIAASTFAVFAYLLGRADYSEYLRLFYLPGAGELSVLALALAGGCLGFLWYNTHPAEVFMGDTGSLALGGVLGAMAILLKAEFLLVIVGGVFVVEVLSVILQVGFFQYTRWRHGTPRRLFRMAPIHHHFEQLGWPESKVVVRFWVMGILCAMVAFSALKIR
jgi:phospho-N-acetylmuramoyl-pentapeptide-transferase